MRRIVHTIGSPALGHRRRRQLSLPARSRLDTQSLDLRRNLHAVKRLSPLITLGAGLVGHAFEEVVEKGARPSISYFRILDMRRASRAQIAAAALLAPLTSPRPCAGALVVTQDGKPFVPSLQEDPTISVAYWSQEH